MDISQSPAPPPVPAPPPPGLRQPPPPAPRSNGWMIFSFVLLGLVFLLGLVAFGSVLQAVIGRGGPMRTDGLRVQEIMVKSQDTANKIALVRLQGIIMSGGSRRGSPDVVQVVRRELEIARKDDRVKGVILEVDSPGGEVLASDEIYRAIEQFQNKSGKPVVASLGSVAASGGYYVASPCRWIVANELTITGSIGVIMHFYNWRGLLDKIGLRPEVYKSGRYKDMLSPDKKESEVTEQERAMVQSLIDETFERFKTVVREGRRWAAEKNQRNQDDKGKELSPTWSEAADGRVLSGKQAYDLGFVDELGNLETAVERARKLANIEAASLVEYQQVFDLSDLFRLFGKLEKRSIQVDFGMDLPELKAGQTYFLSPLFMRQ